MVNRVLVLDDAFLTLWRGSRQVKRWPVDTLTAGWQPSGSSLDGVTLIIASGTLLGTVIDVPPLSRSDRQRYVERQCVQHTTETCGFAFSANDLDIVQRVEGAVGLTAVLTGLAEAAVRFRRVRHTAQIAEVICRCLNPLPSHCIVGWDCESPQLCAVRAGRVVWHRTLTDKAAIAAGFAETEQFLREQKLFHTDEPVARVWLGDDDGLGDKAVQYISEPALASALRRPGFTVSDWIQPPTVSAVLASAVSDLRTPIMRSKWRSRQGIRSAAAVSVLCTAVVLVSAWHTSARVPVLEADGSRTASHVIESRDPSDFSLLDAHHLLQFNRAEMRTASVANWREATRAVAKGLTATPQLTLLSLHWSVDTTVSPTLPYVTVVVSVPPESPEPLMVFLRTVEDAGWRDMREDSDELHRMLAGSTEPIEIEFRAVARVTG